MKNVRPFSKINASLLFVALFGAFTWFVGLTYSKLTEEMLYREKQIISFIGSPALLLGLLALINSRISEEIEAKAEDKCKTKEDELKDNLDSEIKNVINKYKENINQIKTVIESLSSSEERDAILEIIRSIENIDLVRKVSREAADKIAKWFEIKENKSALFKVALEAVSQEQTLNIPSKYKAKFEQDIRQCINWLYSSIQKRTGCLVEASRHASTIKYIPEKYRPYEVAIRAIEKYLEEHQELKPYYTKTEIVKIVMDYLIEELKKMSI